MPVAVERRDPHQGPDLPVADGPKFGQERDHRGRELGADAGNRSQQSVPGPQFRGCRDQFGNLAVQSLYPALQTGDGAVDVGSDVAVADKPQAVLLGAALADQLQAAASQLAQLPLTARRRRSFLANTGSYRPRAIVRIEAAGRRVRRPRFGTEFRDRVPIGLPHPGCPLRDTRAIFEGKCWPFCSTVPTGRTGLSPYSTASLTSGQVRLSN